MALVHLINSGRLSITFAIVIEHWDFVQFNAVRRNNGSLYPSAGLLERTL